MKMQDYAKQIRAEFIRKSAGLLPAKLAAKRDIRIEQLGSAYQLHPAYNAEKHPKHPRIGCQA